MLITFIACRGVYFLKACEKPIHASQRCFATTQNKNTSGLHRKSWLWMEEYHAQRRCSKFREILIFISFKDHSSDGWWSAGPRLKLSRCITVPPKQFPKFFFFRGNIWTLLFTSLKIFGGMILFLRCFRISWVLLMRALQI